MNHIYRLIWSDIARTWVAVAETTKGRGKRASGAAGADAGTRSRHARGASRLRLRALAASLALIGAPAWSLDPSALPTGGKVVAGSAAISQAAKVLNVQQTSQRAALDWQSFNIGAAATVNFKQPSSSAVALNRITGNEASQIYGKLNANGQVFFSNPNGMLFARGAEVNVGGLLATTLNIGNADFMAGNYRFTNPGSGSIRNEGLINVLGSVALIGNEVQNAGNIVATTATLAAGNTVAVDLTGDGLIRARVENPALRTSIENSGSIEAANVTMTAGQSRDMIGSVVNNSGMIRATGLANVGGEIVLEGERVMNAGTLDASSSAGKGGTVQVRARDIELAATSVISSSGNSGGGIITVMGDMQTGSVKVAGKLDASSSNGNGGFIETSAAQVDIANNTKVTTAAAMGLAGTWLIDPVDFIVAAGSAGQTISGMGASTLSSNLAGGNVSIATSATTAGNGDIFVNDVVSWNANKLTLAAHRNIRINASLNGSGSASLALQYGLGTTAGGNLSDYFVNAAVNLPAGPNFSTKLGSDGAVKNYTVITSLGAAGSTTTADLQGMNGNLGGDYALGANIDATATSAWNTGAGFTPVGNWPTLFTGTFDGLGHTVSNISINLPSAYSVGLFGYTAMGSTIRNVGLVNASVTGTNYVGGLVGLNNGTISNSFATGTTSGVGYSIGGLVGGGDTGTISNSYSMGSVSGAGTAGGLIGYTNGTISNSYSTASVAGTDAVGGLVGYSNASTISNSYATGNVSGVDNVGGLVGYNNSAISNSNATGSVLGTSSVGGLAGYNLGTVSNSYATGSVSGGSGVGGLVGQGYGGLSSISSSYASGSVSGTSGVGGLVGFNHSTVENTYATGSVIGASTVGGLVGGNFGAVSNSYWNSDVNAIGMAGIGVGTLTGATSLTTAQMRTASLMAAGLNFTTTPGAAGNNWVILNADGSLQTNASATAGATYPMLASEFSTNITNAHQLQLMAMAPASSYTLGRDIDALKTATSMDVWGTSGFVPVGGANADVYPVNPFTGTFNGQSHTISNLFINLPTKNNVGLFGCTSVSSSIINVGMLGGSVTGNVVVGQLVGNNNAAVSGSYATGSVSASSYAGGLIGSNYDPGRVSNSYATGTVSASVSWVGGLTGRNGTGNISNSFATGSVVGPNGGGLVPKNYGTITNSFWNITTTGKATSAGGTGKTTAEMMQVASFSSWNAATPNTIASNGGSGAVWRIYEGNTYPLLTSFLTPITLTPVYNGSTQTLTNSAITPPALPARSALTSSTQRPV